jgi:hypothetical protein
MPKHVLRDAVVTINGVDLSDHFSSVELSDEAEEVEFTSFSTSGYREFGQGLKDATITCTAFNDYDAGEVDATLYPLYASGGTFPLTVKASSATTSSTNPIWSMTARVFSYSPLSGAVGDANTTELTFRNAGTAGITRGTA